MSLKTDYLTSSPSGFTTAMNTVFDEGVDWVTDNLSDISDELKENAAAGNREFTINVAVTFEVVNLRLEGIHMETFFAGIRSALAAQEIYSNEYTIELNTSVTTSTSIDLNFDF